MTTIINRKNKGISTVLTTLIIVVASVVLGTAVTLFGTSLFQTGAQQQGMSVTNTHLWFNIGAGNPTVEGAAVVRNTGDKLIAVDTIKVRGTSTAFGNWYAAKTVVSATGAVISNVEATAQFVYLSPLAAGATDIDSAGIAIGAGPPNNEPFLVKGTGPVSLEPGATVIIYFSVPSGVVTSSDIGASASMTINAGQITSVQSVSVASENV